MSAIGEGDNTMNALEANVFALRIILKMVQNEIDNPTITPIYDELKQGDGEVVRTALKQMQHQLRSQYQLATELSASIKNLQT